MLKLRRKEKNYFTQDKNEKYFLHLFFYDLNTKCKTCIWFGCEKIVFFFKLITFDELLK